MDGTTKCTIVSGTRTGENWDIVFKLPIVLNSNSPGHNLEGTKDVLLAFLQSSDAISSKHDNKERLSNYSFSGAFLINFAIFAFLALFLTAFLI